MEFSRQEYWRMLLFPSPGDLPDPGIKLRSPALRGDSLSSGSPGERKARWITLNVLNCPTDERPGRLYQSCFKAAAWIHSSWWKAISRLIPVMRSHCWQKWFPTMVTAGGAAASSWNESSCWRWHSKNPCRRERGVDGAAGLGGVLGAAGGFTLSKPFQFFQFRDPQLNLFCPQITIGRRRSYSSVHRQGRNCFSFSYYTERISVHINEKDMNITWPSHL